MRFRLVIAGMALVGIVLGLVLGKSISTTPRYFGDEAFAAVPREEPGDEGYDIDHAVPDTEYPDHYPMVTPNGRIEVAELSSYVRNRSYWRSIGHYDEWYPSPADDAQLERELAAAQALPEADYDSAGAYDSLGVWHGRRDDAGDRGASSPGGPRIVAGPRSLPVDLRGVIGAVRPASLPNSADPNTSAPVLPPAAEALIASPIRR